MVTALFVLAHVGLPSSKAVALPSPGLLGLDQRSSFLGLLKSYKIRSNHQVLKRSGTKGEPS
jgi:hypothetical protein